MPAYVYRARDMGGEMVRGRAEADSERELVTRLRSQGFLVLDMERDRDLKVVLQHRSSFFARRVSGKELAVFARQFATMINAGLPVVAALSVLSRQVSNQRLRHALLEVTADVQAGEGLSTAFARRGNVFPPVMIHMVAAGEVGGILDDVLARMANQFEKEEAIRQKVKSALVYPVIVSCVAVGVVTFLMTFVVPKFVQVYADLGTTLPFMTTALITVSTACQQYWWAALSLGVLAYMGARYAKRTERGALLWDRYLLKLPIVGPMIAKQSIARFSRTLSGLLASGITILKALAVVERTVGNLVVAEAVREAIEDVRQGQTLVVPLRRSKIFPDMVLEMVSVGEETGSIEEMLEKVADFYEEEVQRSAERLSSSIEPVIIVGLAVTVGLIVASMMMPIFNLWTAF